MTPATEDGIALLSIRFNKFNEKISFRIQSMSCHSAMSIVPYPYRTTLWPINGNKLISCGLISTFTSNWLSKQRNKFVHVNVFDATTAPFALRINFIHSFVEYGPATGTHIKLNVIIQCNGLLCWAHWLKDARNRISHIFHDRHIRLRTFTLSIVGLTQCVPVPVCEWDKRIRLKNSISMRNT